jgi:hypothetical protein
MSRVNNLGCRKYIINLSLLGPSKVFEDESIIKRTTVIGNETLK